MAIARVRYFYLELSYPHGNPYVTSRLRDDPHLARFISLLTVSSTFPISDTPDRPANVAAFFNQVITVLSHLPALEELKLCLHPSIIRVIGIDKLLEVMISRPKRFYYTMAHVYDSERGWTITEPLPIHFSLPRLFNSEHLTSLRHLAWHIPDGMTSADNAEETNIEPQLQSLRSIDFFPSTKFAKYLSMLEYDVDLVDFHQFPLMPNIAVDYRSSGMLSFWAQAECDPVWSRFSMCTGRSWSA